ncbi:uncharacterized protein [Amphiura filiformis]|uniref:uncharacterized protein n=1 Tax=Amphiura filiformis TaxID=82378 RepID=UPI003B20FFF3
MAIIVPFLIGITIFIGNWSSCSASRSASCITLTTSAINNAPDAIPTIIVANMLMNISVNPHGTLLPVTINLLESYVENLNELPAENYYDIVLGTNAQPIHPGAFGNSATITRFIGGPTFTPVSPTDTMSSVSSETVNIVPGSFTDLFVQLENFPDGSATINAGKKDNEPFVSLSDPDPLVVRFLGLWGLADWQVCSEFMDSIASGAKVLNDAGMLKPVLTDGDKTTCVGVTDASNNPSGVLIDLGQVKEVLGVQIWNNDNTISGAQVSVGSCGQADVWANTFPSTAEIGKNIKCGVPITAGEAEEPRIYRHCPSNTYGNLVYIVDPTGTVLDLCEIDVYGLPIPDSKQIKIEFVPSQSTVLESEGDVDVTLVRTGGSTNNPTCSTVELSVEPTAGSNFVNGLAIGGSVCTTNDDIAGDSYVEFDTTDTTQVVTIDICEDTIVEGDEYAKFGITTNHGGASASMTLGIMDNDPTYVFVPDVYEVIEGVGQVDLRIQRQSYTAEETSITIRTDLMIGVGFVDATADVDYPWLMPGETTVTFPADEIWQTITIQVTDDDDIEPTEVFAVVIEVDPPVIAGIDIIDDEPSFELSGPVFMGIETDGFIAVQIDNVGYQDVAGELVITSSAIGGLDDASLVSDFPPFTRTVSFEPGDAFQIVEVPIVNDTAIEASEDFQVSISGMFVNGLATATLTIADDDATVSMEQESIMVLEREGFVEVVIIRDNTGFIDRLAWVDLELISLTATLDEDYTPQIIRAYFEPNKDTTVARIRIINDFLVEPNETFLVRIVNADSDVDSDKSETLITIENDDALIYLVQSPDSVSEGDIYTAIIMREGSLNFTQRVYLNTNSDGPDAATAGTDFEVHSATVIEFDEGESTKTHNISTFDDELVEDDETFRISISNPNDIIDKERDEIMIHIIDNDAFVGFEFRSYEGLEDTGSPSVVPVKIERRGDTEESNSYGVFTQYVGSAIGGKDYDEIFGLPVMFRPEDDTFSIDVVIIGDDEPELPEVFQLLLVDLTAESNNGQFTSVANVTILDDDNSQFGFQELSYSVDEGLGDLIGTIVRQGSTDGYVDLLVTTSPGSASFPADYKPEVVTVNFQHGQQLSDFRIAITRDLDFEEGEEIFFLYLTVDRGFGYVDPVRQEAEVAISDSSSGFSLSTASSRVLESTPGYVTVTISRSGVTTTNATVSLKTTDGTATHSGDFKGFNVKTFFFPSGTNEQSFRIPIDNNDILESKEEDFTVSIISADGKISGNNTLAFTIVDDDGFFSFSASPSRDQNSVNYTVAENSGIVDVIVYRTGNLEGVSRVRLVTNEDSAKADEDFQPFRSRAITFTQLHTKEKVSVRIIDDEIGESNETFYLQLENPDNGAVISPNKARIVILANDNYLRRADLSTKSIITIAMGTAGILILFALSALILWCIVARRNRFELVKRASSASTPFPLNVLPQQVETNLVQSLNSYQ